MKTILVPALSLAALALAGFALTAAKAPAAPATVSPVAAPVAEAKTYTIDSVHSTVIFSTMHMETARFYGRFNDFSGTITFDEAAPEKSKVEISIKTTTVDTANKGRDDHLRGADFFDVQQFPAATFNSTSVKKAEGKNWAVTGTLTFHGVKKEITLQLEKTGAGKGRKGESLIGFHGTFSIQRGDFGIEYGKGMLGEQVDLILSIEAAAD